jgi:serine/threonine-protein kinase RsbW
MTESTTRPSRPADDTTTQVDRVQLRMPADSAYIGVLRTATAGLAARRDFTLDEIEDLRIAVDEMSALLLTQVRAGASLDCLFELGSDDLTVHVSVESDHPKAPREDSLAWTLLTALAGELHATVSDTALTLSLHKRRSVV